MQKVPYIIVRSGQDPRLRAYTQERERLHAPIIYSVGRGKTAHVEMDLIYVEDPHRFNTDEMFRLKMFEACEQAAGSYASPFQPGLFTLLDRVPVENAETLMQTFFAIYQQATGHDVPMPVFEHPIASPLRQRLHEAIGRGYTVARGVDMLPERYKLWCRVHGRPYVCVWVQREGYAKFVAHWEAGSLADLASLQASLQRVAEEWGIYHDHMVIRGHRGPILMIYDSWVKSVCGWLKQEAAEELARAMVRLLPIDCEAVR